MRRLPPPQWTCAHPADCAEGNTQRPVFSSLPVFPLGKPCYSLSRATQPVRFCPRGAWSVGGNGGHTIFPPPAPPVSLPLSTAVSRSAENLAQFLRAGTRSREVWVLVGCLGLVIFLCIIYLCFIILWNLSDPVFIATGLGP